MSTEEILITHAGYTDTAYSSCGDRVCTEAILEAVGVPSHVLAGLRTDDIRDLEVGDDTQVTCGLLDQGDSDEWCACCGTFLHHGLNCECEDSETDRPNQAAPHPDLWGAASIKEYWGWPL